MTYRIARRSLLAAFVAAPVVASAKPAAVTLLIASDGDELLFKPDRLACKAGAAVTLVLHHAGSIIHDPHDWVLLKPGRKDAFLAIADKAADAKDGVNAANADMVLARSPLCPMGKSVRVTFTAPAPGHYPFVCSVPGHGETMNGILTVTA